MAKSTVDTQGEEGNQNVLKRTKSKKRQLARRAVARAATEETEITGSRRRAGGRSAASVIEGVGRRLAENNAQPVPAAATGLLLPTAMQEVQS
jgi:hypothetical protein